VAPLQEKLAAVNLKKRPRDHRRYRFHLAHAIVRTSIAVRKLGFTNNERKRLIDRVNRTVDGMRSLDRQIQNLEKRAEATRSEEQRKEYKKQSRAVRGELEKLEAEAGLLFQELKRTQREIIQGDMDQARADRSQLASRGLDCKEVHQSRLAVPRPDSGRQHRTDEGGRQVRIPPRL
jgi:RNA polymerase primary sigma factor